MIRSVVQGCGSYLPERVVTNEELSKSVETTDEWIRQRTGICQRHIAADGETVIAAVSTTQKALSEGLKGTKNKSAAAAVGKAIAEKAKAAGIEAVAFDRSGFRYHGRVAALADAAREAGLKF